MQPNLPSLSERSTLDEVHPPNRIPSVRHLTSDSYRHENRSPASTRPSPRCVYPPRFGDADDRICLLMGCFEPARCKTQQDPGSRPAVRLWPLPTPGIIDGPAQGSWW